MEPTKENKALKKSKIITGVCGGVVIALLGLSVFSFIQTPVEAASTKKGSGTDVEIQLDKRVYNGIINFFDSYNHPSDTASAKSEDDTFITKDGKLYVVIDGVAYPVYETEDGELVVEAYDPDGLIGTEDADGHKIIAVTEDGLPIIGYDDLGNAIIGRPVGEVALTDAIDIDNPRITVDENGNRYYHIVWGDTLCKISSDIHYSVDEIAEYNHIRNVNLIYAESDLRIPESGWTEPSDEKYTRKSKSPVETKSADEEANAETGTEENPDSATAETGE